MYGITTHSVKYFLHIFLDILYSLLVLIQIYYRLKSVTVELTTLTQFIGLDVINVLSLAETLTLYLCW